MPTRDYARQQRPQRTPAKGRAAPARGGASAGERLPLWVWMVVGVSAIVFIAALWFITRPVGPMDMAPTSAAKPAKVIEIPPKEPARFAFYDLLPSYEVVVPDEVINPPKPAANPNAAQAAKPPPRSDLPPDLQAATATSAQDVRPAAGAATASKPSMATVAATPQAPTPAQAAAPQPTATLAANERFVVQVAAYRSAADAEQRVAALALAGVTAKVEAATLPNGEQWHRVRLGPFTSAASAAAAQQAVKSQGMGAVVMKVRS